MASNPIRSLPNRTHGVISRALGDEFVVIHPRTQTAHALSGLPAQVWRTTDGGPAPLASRDEVDDAVAKLIELDLLVAPSGLTRRGALRRGGVIVAAAGIATIALPEAIAAASAVPTITTLSPTSGPIAGGTTVTITGTGFNSGTTVTWDGANLAVASRTGTTSITVVSPAHAVGPVNVFVTSSSMPSNTAVFTYVTVPAVNSVSPATGSTTLPTTVVITGTGFTGATSVNVIGGSIDVSPTSFTVDSDTQITAIFAAHVATPGVQHLHVTTPGGTSPNNSNADKFNWA